LTQCQSKGAVGKSLDFVCINLTSDIGFNEGQIIGEIRDYDWQVLNGATDI
jgi:hypothetical protein